ncbi:MULTISPECIES: hypothetical protein [unclassified Neisseria]|uniref:hypothetical protein n=1 Tax=unclassified Neisseria TaxID=2623750 RepID=UPI001071A4E8|nr:MULTISPECIES: hypothetical protein [unclassified Neisseria]MBF0803332.1 hypothetical protein [Neisseria sp. 19428wB4_WF04]TFU44000.1 hypothetical protein E4T99_03015 [Neisseria sp. WF04]
MNKNFLIILSLICLSACGKSAEEIELEREKIALQREMLRQQKSQQPATPASRIEQPKQVQTESSHTVTVETTPQVAQPKEREPRRASKGVLISNAKQYAGGTLLRSLQEYYRDNESILCGEYMVGDQFRRFVFVQTYNEQQGTWVKNFLADPNYSHEYTQNTWREYCR